MAPNSKSRSRRAATSPPLLSIALGPVGIGVLMVAVIGGLWLHNRPQRVPFEPGTARGEAALGEVQVLPDQGRNHVAPGQSVDYDSDFPTSGPHDPQATLPGMYDQEQPLEKLVHALEHGNIVIYYDDPGTEAMDTLAGWTRQFPGIWDGLVVVPRAGLGETVVLTAWTKKLVLPAFDSDAAASFIDAYRGRGPENPVR